MPTPLTLEQLQPFLDFVNATLPTKMYTVDVVGTWTAGRPLVATGVGYGVQLGTFPASGVTSVNGMTGDVTVTKTTVGLGNVPDIDCTNASNITSGTLPLSVIPAAALERLVHVADEAARFALTTASVQNGDIVQQDDTGIMYKVVDDGNLDNSAGYNEFTAGIAAAVNWTGILGVPQNIVDIAAADEVDLGMLVYFSGQWVSRSPHEVRDHLDLPVSASWNMSQVVGWFPSPDILLPVTGTTLGDSDYETVSLDGKTHYVHVTGVGAEVTYSASTDNYYQISQPGPPNSVDLQIPGAGTVCILLEVDEPFVLPNGTFQHSLSAFGVDWGMLQYFSVDVYVEFAGSVIRAGISTHAGNGPTNQVGALYPILTQWSAPHRVLLYVDGGSRKVGAMVDGVDLGWLQDDTSVDFQIPPQVAALTLAKSTSFSNNMDVGDPALGQEIHATHSIDPIDMTEAVALSPQQWAVYRESEASLPPNADVMKRYFVTHPGSFNGAHGDIGDIAEVTSLVPPEVFIYPKESRLARLADLSGYATQPQLASVQSQVDEHTGDITALQGDMSTLQSLITTVDNRTTREIFLAKGWYIRGFSTSGDDLDATGVEEDPLAVIVSDFDENGDFVGVSSAFVGMPPGAVAYKEGGVWTYFIPLPGDEYKYEVRTYIASSEGSVPVVFRVTYVGPSPRYPTGVRTLDPRMLSPETEAGYQNRDGALRNLQPSIYGGSFFGRLGWRMDGPVHGPSSEKVRYVYHVDNDTPLRVDPYVDDNVLVIISSLAFATTDTLTLLVSAPPGSDTVSTPDTDYEYLPVAATKTGRITVVVENNGVIYTNFKVEVGLEKGEGSSIVWPVNRHHEFMPLFREDGSVIPGSDGVYLTYRLAPVYTGPFTNPASGLLVTRVDRNSSVTYSTPDSPYTGPLLDQSLSVMRLEVMPGSGVVFLPTPRHEGQRLIIKMAQGYLETPYLTTGSDPWEGIHSDTRLPARMRAGESLDLCACREVFDVDGLNVTVQGPLVWSVLPGIRSGLPSQDYINVDVGTAIGPTPLNADYVEVEVSSLTNGHPVRLYFGPYFIPEEGDVAVVKVHGVDVLLVVSGIHITESFGSVEKLPESITRPLKGPFEAMYLWQRRGGVIVNVGSFVLKEASKFTVRESELSTVTYGLETSVLTLPGIDVDKVVQATVGVSAMAVHRIVVQAAGPGGHYFFSERVVRFYTDGSLYVKVADTTIYEDSGDLGHGTLYWNVDDDTGSNVLTVSVTSSIPDDIVWNAMVYSTYS